jgi:hypothetical protein
MPLARLSCDVKGRRDLEILRSIRTLQMINGQPAALFKREIGDRCPLPP